MKEMEDVANEIKKIIEEGHVGVEVNISQRGVGITTKIMLTLMGIFTFSVVLFSDAIFLGIAAMAVGWGCGIVIGKEYREYSLEVEKKED